MNTLRFVGYFRVGLVRSFGQKCIHISNCREPILQRLTACASGDDIIITAGWSRRYSTSCRAPTSTPSPTGNTVSTVVLLLGLGLPFVVLHIFKKSDLYMVPHNSYSQQNNSRWFLFHVALTNTSMTMKIKSASGNSCQY